MEATIGFDLRSTVSDASWTVDRGHVLGDGVWNGHLATCFPF